MTLRLFPDGLSDWSTATNFTTILIAAIMWGSFSAPPGIIPQTALTWMWGEAVTPFSEQHFILPSHHVVIWLSQTVCCWQ